MAAGRRSARTVHFQVLGPLEVTVDGTRLALGGPKQRLVLAHLLIRANELVATETLIDELWGEDPPETARASLHSYISHLRKALGPERLVGRPPGYVLEAPDEEVDAARFEAQIAHARGRLGTDPATAARGMRDALRLWKGDALADLAGELSLQPEIARLSELRLGAFEDLFEAELALGRHANLVPELERLVSRNPLRERLCGQLMTALYRTGRQAEALAVYHRLRGALGSELGLDPSPAVESLQGRILTHDPSLDLQGEALRGYRLVEQIGGGPLGVVHRALEPQSGRDLVIKVLGRQVANDTEFVRRFDAAARRLFRLEHPRVVPLYDWWREPDVAYLAMRFMRGGSLADRLRGKGIGSAEALAWSEQIGYALAAAHREGIVHGDIRPGNVLFDEDGSAHLSDFTIGFDAALIGSAKKLGEPSAYLAPERASGGPPSAAADIFAFGVLLRDLLRAAGLADGPDLAAVFERATAAAPDGRPRTAAEVVAAVRTAVLSPAPATASAGLPSGPPRNPYKGLRAFEEADAADFVGREELVGHLIERLIEPDGAAHLLVVVGPSGSGKSSVVNAGLVPSLRAGAVPGSERWFVAGMTPGPRPFEQLERALLGVAVNVPASLDELLEGDGLGPAIERVLPETAELLLVIDQFEELFTLVDEPTRSRFLGLIARAVDDPTSRVRFVLTLRADFYDRALRHEHLGRLVAARTEAIPPFGPAELERVVIEPASRAGLRLEQGLAARIVADMREQPGGLPLLQYALTELWERRDGARLSRAAYEASGGIAGAVGRRAEHLVSQLDAESLEAARQLFLRLVEPGEGTPDTSRRIRSGELQALVRNVQVMGGLTESFARYRLLLFDRDPETREPTISLAHEALLRAWPRLQLWVDEARDDLRSQRRLALAATQWREGGRDSSFLLTGTRLEQAESWASATRVLPAPAEREYLAASVAERERREAGERERRTREAALERQSIGRLRALVVVLGVGALLASSLSLFALGEGQRAAEEARVATARELAAAAVANLGVDPERSILLALAAIDETRSASGVVLQEAQEALHQAVVASRVVLTVPDEGGYVDWADNADLGSVFVTQGVEESGIVNIRDSTTGIVLRSWRADAIDVNDVAFSADGSVLATSGDDGHLKLWDPVAARELASWGGPSVQDVWGPSFSVDGSLVAAAWSTEGTVRVFNTETHETLLDLVDLAGPYRTSFSPDGTRLAVALNGDSIAFVVDIDTGERRYTAEGHSSGVTDVSWSPDGTLLATASDDGTAKVFDAATGELRSTLVGHSNGIFDLDWSPDSRHLLTAGLDGTARLWSIDPAGAHQVLSLSSQELRGGVGGVAFSPDGEEVITAQYTDVAVKIWDIGLGGNAELANFPAAPGDYPGLAFSPDGDDLVAGTGSGSVTVWSIETGQATLVTRHNDGMVAAVAVSADGTLVASVGSDGTRVWDATTGRLRFSVLPDEARNGPWSMAVAWSPVANVLATAAAAGPVRIADSAGQILKVFDQAPGLGARDLAFSPDGRLLAMSIKQGPSERWDPQTHRVMIWDWEQGALVMTIPTSSVGLAFDPTGTRLATSNIEEGEAVIWDVATGAKLVTLTGHSGGVHHVAWDTDPARDRIATSSGDGTVRIWDAATGVNLLVLRGHSGPVWNVAFSPDGSRLASSSRDGTVRVWALDVDDLIGIARGELTRGLTAAECREFLHLQACP